MTVEYRNLYNKQFDTLNSFVGKSIDEIVFYLKKTDENYSEVQNSYGKSLHSGIDIKVDNTYYSIGCRFQYGNSGLTISHGRTTEFEFIENEKSPVVFNTSIIGKIIKSVEIFWMKIPTGFSDGYYPQEFVITTENGFLLLSSIEVDNTEIGMEYTDELLVIEIEEIAKELKLGRYGLGINGREWFKNFEELYETQKKNWL